MKSEHTHVTFLLGDGNSNSRIISRVHLRKLHGFRTQLSDICVHSWTMFLFCEGMTIKSS